MAGTVPNEVANRAAKPQQTGTGKLRTRWTLYVIDGRCPIIVSDLDLN